MTTAKVFRTVLLAAWMLAVGCDDAAPVDPSELVTDLGPTPDFGPTPDGEPPDMIVATPDGGPPDAEPPDPDMAPPEMTPPTPGAPGVVAGGARRASDRFELTVTVGGAAPTAARQSARFQTRIGVGIPSISAQGAP